MRCRTEIEIADQACCLTQPSILTLSQPVLALTLEHYVSDNVATRIPIFKPLV